jgi:isoleucyl-tRNA synthetase
MAVVRETVRLGLAARGHGQAQGPPAAARPPSWSPRGEERAAIERLGRLVLEELNVKELRYVAQADELGSYEVKPNYRALGRASASRCAGRRGGRGARPAHVGRRAARRGQRRRSRRRPRPRARADDLLLAMQPLDGYQLEREGSHAVALELELDDELRREGLAREVVHAVQNARKAAGLEVRTGSSSRSAATRS